MSSVLCGSLGWVWSRVRLQDCGRVALWRSHALCCVVSPVWAPPCMVVPLGLVVWPCLCALGPIADVWVPPRLGRAGAPCLH
eukprot:scaffold116109_cov27-Tisochrysis_lutea.AAC.1